MPSPRSAPTLPYPPGFLQFLEELKRQAGQARLLAETAASEDAAQATLALLWTRIFDATQANEGPDELAKLATVIQRLSGAVPEPRRRPSPLSPEGLTAEQLAAAEAQLQLL